MNARLPQHSCQAATTDWPPPEKRQTQPDPCCWKHSSPKFVPSTGLAKYYGICQMPHQLDQYGTRPFFSWVWVRKMLWVLSVFPPKKGLPDPHRCAMVGQSVSYLLNLCIKQLVVIALWNIPFLHLGDLIPWVRICCWFHWGYGAR